MINNSIIKIRLYIEFAIIYVIYFFLNMFPKNLVTIMGGIIFGLIGPYTKKNKTVKKNLNIIFPNKTNKEIKNIAKKSWMNVGKTFFELLILPKITKSQNRIKLQGSENLKNIVKNKEKIMFVGIHQSNWEILLPSIDKLGISVGGIYRHINNPHLNNFILKIRNKSKFSNESFYTPKGKKSAKEILVGIKKNISVVLLIDQKDSAGDLVNFFNIPSKTQTGFIKIAKKNNLKIIPIENIRNKDNSFTLIFHKPLNNILINSDLKIINQIHLIIENWIKKNPTDYFLQHNRFS